jgi:hypothetical protein
MNAPDQFGAQRFRALVEGSAITTTASVYIVTATKPLVDALLAMNTHNRSVRQTAVDRLTNDIQRGSWLLTASGVGVDWNGNVTDGQHRLYAIKAAGYPPVQFVLAVGLDPASQGVVDRHAKRSLADALSLLQGRTISTALIAASNSLLTIKNSTSRSEPFVFTGAHPSDSAAASNLLAWEDDLLPIMSVIGTSTRASVVGAFAIYYRHHPENALQLADQVKRGVELREDDPAYRLRALLTTPAVRGGSQGSLRAFQYAVTAICAHSQGRLLRTLKPSESWSNSGWKNWRAD